jgi:G3E family GTPase
VLGAAPAAGRRGEGGGHATHDHAHPSFETWSWSGEAPVSGAGLVEELKALPDGIVRAKGLLRLREDEARRYVLQVVGRRFSIQAERPWGEAAPASQLVVIGLPGSVDAQRLAATLERLTAPGTA